VRASVEDPAGIDLRAGNRLEDLQDKLRQAEQKLHAAESTGKDTDEIRSLIASLGAKIDAGFAEQREGFDTLGRQLGEVSAALTLELRQGNEAVLRQAVQVAAAADDSRRALAEQVRAAASATAEDLAGMKRDATEQVQAMLRGLDQLGSSLEAAHEQGAGALSAVKGLEAQLAAAQAQPSGKAESAESIKSYLTALQQQQQQLHDQVFKTAPACVRLIMIAYRSPPAAMHFLTPTPT